VNQCSLELGILETSVLVPRYYFQSFGLEAQESQSWVWCGCWSTSFLPSPQNLGFQSSMFI